jgi:hypothetical protein
VSTGSGRVAGASLPCLGSTSEAEALLFSIAVSPLQVMRHSVCKLQQANQIHHN